MKIAIIPARGGSKRIPRKNVKPFCGKPMIAWPIAAALKSSIFDRVIVSTEDEEIAAVAQKHGAEVPFRRPEALADDHTETLPVIAHAINVLEADHSVIDVVCCIYPTAPLLTALDLQAGLELFAAGDCDYVYSISPFESAIERALRVNPGGYVSFVDPQYFHCRTQDLEAAYRDAGQFYYASPATWKSGVTIVAARSRPVVIPGTRVQDIDTAEDWALAEIKMKALTLNQ